MLSVSLEGATSEETGGQTGNGWGVGSGGDVSALAEVLNSIIESAIEGSNAHGASESSESEEENAVEDLHVGMVVTVERRMWPGINKPGGVGFVTKIREDGTVDVKYHVVGGREIKISPKYVHTKDVNNVGKREHRQRRLYDPATGRAWEPTIDFSKVLDRRSYLEALEEEVRRMRIEANGGVVDGTDSRRNGGDMSAASSSDEDEADQTIPTIDIAEISSSDDEESNMPLTEFLKKSSAKPSSEASAAAKSGDNGFPAALDTTTAVAMAPATGPKYNPSGNVADDEDEDDDVPLASMLRAGTSARSTKKRRSSDTDLDPAPSALSNRVRRRVSNDNFIQGESHGYAEGDENQGNISSYMHPTVPKAYTKSVRRMKLKSTLKEGNVCATYLENRLEYFQSKIELLNCIQSDATFARRFGRRETKIETRKAVFQTGLDRLQFIFNQIDRKKKDDTRDTIRLDNRYETIITKWSNFQSLFQQCSDRRDNYGKMLQQEYLARSTQNDSSSDSPVHKRRKNKRRSRAQETHRATAARTSAKPRHTKRAKVATAMVALPSATAPATGEETIELDIQENRSQLDVLAPVVKLFCGGEVSCKPLDRVSNVGGPSELHRWLEEYQRFVDQLGPMKKTLQTDRSLLPSMDIPTKTMKIIRHHTREVERRVDKLLDLLSRAKYVKTNERETDNRDAAPVYITDSVPNATSAQLGVEAAGVVSAIVESNEYDRFVAEESKRDFPKNIDPGARYRAMRDAGAAIFRCLDAPDKAHSLFQRHCNTSSEFCTALFNAKANIADHNKMKSAIPQLFDYFGAALLENSSRLSPSVAQYCRAFLSIMDHYALTYLIKDSTERSNASGTSMHVLLEHIAGLENNRGAFANRGSMIGAIMQKEEADPLFVSICIEYFCSAMKWVSVCTDEQVQDHRCRISLRTLAILIADTSVPMMGFGSNNNQLSHPVQLLACSLFYMRKTEGVWNKIMERFMWQDIYHMPLHPMQQLRPDAALLGWYQDGGKKLAAKHPTVIGNEGKIEVAWDLFLLVVDTDCLLQQHANDYVQLHCQGPGAWNLLETLAFSWLEFQHSPPLAPGQNSYFSMSSPGQSFPVPYDSAWRYTHKIMSRVTHCVNSLSASMGSHLGKLNSGFSFKLWQRLHMKVFNLDISDSILHHAKVCHDKHKRCLGSAVDKARRHCNTVFPAIPPTPRPSLCTSSFPPYIVGLLENDRVFPFFTRDNSARSVPFGTGDSISTCACKCILAQLLRTPVSSRKKALNPYFRMLHKMKAPASLFRLEKDEDEDVVVHYREDKPGTIYGLRSVVELILTLAISCSETEELSRFGLKSLTKYMSKLLNVNASDTEARAVCVQGWAIFFALHQKLPWNYATHQPISSAARCGSELLRMIRVTANDAPKIASKDANDFTRYVYERYQRLVRMELDCLRSIVDIGRSNPGASKLLQGNWGFRFGEHGFVHDSILLLVSRPKLFYRADFEVVVSLVNKILSPFTNIWPSENMNSETDMILDIEVLRAQQKIRKQLDEDVKALVKEAPKYFAAINEFKSTMAHCNYSHSALRAFGSIAAVSLNPAVAEEEEARIKIWEDIICKWINETFAGSSTKPVGPLILLEILNSRGIRTYPNTITTLFKNPHHPAFSKTGAILLKCFIVIAINPGHNGGKTIAMFTQSFISTIDRMVGEPNPSVHHRESIIVLLKNICRALKSDDGTLPNNNVFQAILREINRFQSKTEVQKLLPVVRESIIVLIGQWRRLWAEASFSVEFISTLYSNVISGVLRQLDKCYLMPTLASEEKSILELVSLTFFIQPLLQKDELQSTFANEKSLSILRGAEAEKKKCYNVLLRCFSHMPYFTNRHIAALLKGVVLSYFGSNRPSGPADNVLGALNQFLPSPSAQHDMYKKIINLKQFIVKMFHPTQNENLRH